MGVLAQAKAYLDVGGTDYSSYVLSVQTSRPISEQGKARVILSNKNGQYKSTFSKHQIVAVALARATIGSYSDFFTGTDGAAPSAAKWGTGGASVIISGNKLCVTAGAAGYAYAYNVDAFTPPYIYRVWFKAGATSTESARVIAVNSAMATAYWEFYNDNTPKFHHYYRTGGVWTDGGAWTTAFAADTWYILEVQQDSTTHCYLRVYDVFGTWLETHEVTHDAVATIKNSLSTYNLVTAYYDSFLVTVGSTYCADQVFEGYIDQVEMNEDENGDTVTLHCVDYALDLEQSYDDTYGRTDSTFTPTYGATNDISAIITALLASGWTCTVPSCGVHDTYKFSQGSSRLHCINQVIQSTPYLGWYVLPMKHLVCTLPTAAYTIDKYTDNDAANWDNVDFIAINNNGTVKVQGSHSTQFTADTVTGHTGPANRVTGPYSGASYPTATLFPVLDLYVAMYTSLVGNGNFTIRVYTSVIPDKYWYRVLSFDTYGTSADSPDDMFHYPLSLPDADGTHGWTAVNSPSLTGDIQRLWIGEVTIGGTVQVYIDSYNLWSRKKIGGKYTLSNILSATRGTMKTPYNYVYIINNVNTVTQYDATLATVDGTRELLYPDKNITSVVMADSLGRMILENAYRGRCDAITVKTINPGDTYNVMLGDTLTMTISNLNLSSDTRALTAVIHELAEDADWVTTYVFGGKPVQDASRVFELMNLKRR